MTTFAAFLAPLVFLLPAAPFSGHAETDETDAPGFAKSPEARADEPTPPANRFPLSAVLRPDAHQVRIEQRITIRISPRTPEMQSAVAEIQRRQRNTRWEERKTSGCIPMASLVGVRVNGADQLLLYTRDRSMFTARLEGSCSARDFYSGFYVEPNKDGKLCIRRDRLQSRNGASCQIAHLGRLVPVSD
ncbi:hypothetical protein F7D01_01050 [Erythrobacter sp. 3-20A1M]|uniref:hypothetical protein n=1 Tax=Erythrobacter sp. 3-20A1M TaxID=2653850 RepID=UPI001BFC1C0B|nr:hypothetical protein [Erythrobacter sp. 3-20A1M]QWC55862.1 hypothetical protein F7D01_01050 [Erythrobacter sp. 3-20A1M]